MWHRQSRMAAPMIEESGETKEARLYRNFMAKCRYIPKGKCLRKQGYPSTNNGTQEIVRTPSGWVWITIRYNKVDRQHTFNNKKELMDIVKQDIGLSVFLFPKFKAKQERKYNFCGRIIEQ